MHGTLRTKEQRTGEDEDGHACTEDVHLRGSVVSPPGEAFAPCPAELPFGLSQERDLITVILYQQLIRHARHV